MEEEAMYQLLWGKPLDMEHLRNGFVILNDEPFVAEVQIGMVLTVTLFWQVNVVSIALERTAQKVETLLYVQVVIYGSLFYLSVRSC